MKNNVSITHLKDGSKMYHVKVADDTTSEQLQVLMDKAVEEEREQMVNMMPPYDRCHHIDEDKIYNFSMTGLALKDMINSFNGDTPSKTKYGRIRIFQDRIVFAAAGFADNGEVVPMPHAIVAKFTKE